MKKLLSTVFLVLTSCTLLSQTKSGESSLPTVTTKYGINMSSVAEFDSVIVEISVDNKVVNRLVKLPSDMDAQKKIRWDIVATETKVVKVKSRVYKSHYLSHIQEEIFTSGQAPKIPRPDKFAELRLPDTIFTVKLGEKSIVSTDVDVIVPRENQVSDPAMASVLVGWDVSGDGVVDTVFQGSNGTLWLQKSVVGMADGLYQSKFTVQDALGRSISYDRPLLVQTFSQGQMTDERDGQTYKSVRIGTQVWMAQNLNYVPAGKDGNGAWCYENSVDSCMKYGRLYDWTTAKGVCPQGWHLPSDGEWAILSNLFGGDANAGLMINATLSVLFAGNRSGNGNFNAVGTHAIFWSTSENNTYDAWFRVLESGYGGFNRNYEHKTNGFSVRCLQGFSSAANVNLSSSGGASSAHISSSMKMSSAQYSSSVKISSSMISSSNISSSSGVSFAAYVDFRNSNYH